MHAVVGRRAVAPNTWDKELVAAAENGAGKMIVSGLGVKVQKAAPDAIRRGRIRLGDAPAIREGTA
jgi:hypothetical protein